MEAASSLQPGLAIDTPRAAQPGASSAVPPGLQDLPVSFYLDLAEQRYIELLKERDEGWLKPNAPREDR